MHLLSKIRLSWFFFVFFSIFLTVTYVFDGIALATTSLTLFSVNSLLFGFFILPILTAQRNRIDELTKAIRAEANAMFDILLKTKKLPRRSRNLVQGMIEDYITASFRERRPGAGEEEYERAISYCLDYEGTDKDDRDKIEKVLNGLVANQQNRSQLAMHLGNRIYSNEWWIMLLLFSITLGYVMMLQVADLFVLHFIKALLCTGLSMLVLSLLKLSTLTHKKARGIWKPFENLKTSRFRRID